MFNCDFFFLWVWRELKKKKRRTIKWRRVRVFYRRGTRKNTLCVFLFYFMIIIFSFCCLAGVQQYVDDSGFFYRRMLT